MSDNLFQTPTEAKLREEIKQLKAELAYALRAADSYGICVTPFGAVSDDLSLQMPLQDRVTLQLAGSVRAIAEGGGQVHVFGVSRGRSTDSLEAGYYMPELPRSANDVAHVMALCHEKFVRTLLERVS